jgi:hypothetical protein
MRSCSALVGKLASVLNRVSSVILAIHAIRSKFVQFALRPCKRYFPPLPTVVSLRDHRHVCLERKGVAAFAVDATELIMNAPEQGPAAVL